MLRIVADPGVLIAALISPKGAPAGLLLAWLEGRLQLIVSPRLLRELETVLKRPKFRSYVSEEESGSYVDLFRNSAVLVPDPPTERGLAPDPGDDYLISLARASRADSLVSGDPHLTGIRKPEPPILTPRELMNKLGEGP